MRPPPVQVPGGGHDDVVPLFSPEDTGRSDKRSEGARGWGRNVAPTGWVTIVFCDIPAAAELYAAHPVEMCRAVAAYLDVARELLSDCNGYEVRNNGDLLMCAFSSATDATNWCYGVQLRLLSLNEPEDELLRHIAARPEPWPGQGDPSLPPGTPGSGCIYRGLRARMGLHSGKPYFELDKGTGQVQYFGTMVQVAARLACLAQGGQILISQKAYQELAPYCWPDEMNPLHQPPVLDMLGWRQFRDRDEGSFETSIETVQIFQLLPLCLSERVFNPLPVQEQRLKAQYESIVTYTGEKAQFAQNRENQRLAMKARLAMLQKEREQLNTRVQDRDKVLLRYAQEKVEWEKRQQSLIDQLNYVRGEREQLTVELAEAKAEVLLDADEAKQRLMVQLDLLKEEVQELKNKKCELCQDPLDFEMPLSTDDDNCVVVSGLQSSITEIYSSALRLVFQQHKPERVKMIWTDDRPHLPTVTPVAHIHFPSKEQALQAANTVLGCELLGSGPLAARVKGGDPRLEQWQKETQSIQRERRGKPQHGEEAPREAQLQELPEGRGDLFQGVSAGIVLSVSEEDDPTTPPQRTPFAPAAAPSRDPKRMSLVPLSRTDHMLEKSQVELTLLKTQNMRMRQILGRFHHLARSFVNSGSRTIEREWWGADDPTLEDDDDLEREDIEFEATQVSTVQWVEQTQQVLMKRSAAKSPWTESTADLLQLLNSIRRLVLAARTLARRRLGGLKSSRETQDAPSPSAAQGGGGSADALDRVQQALMGFFRNIAGTRTTGVQAGWHDPRHKAVQTEHRTLAPVPRPQRRPKLCKGSNVHDQHQCRPTPPRTPAAAAAGGREAPARAEGLALAPGRPQRPRGHPQAAADIDMLSGFGQLLMLQQQQREDLWGGSTPRLPSAGGPGDGAGGRGGAQTARPPAAAAGGGLPVLSAEAIEQQPAAPADAALSRPPTRPSPMTPPERERWMRWLRTRAVHSPSGSGRWPPAQSPKRSARPPSIPVSLPRV